MIPIQNGTIEKLRISNFAITPEIRFYLNKKGFGRDFYLAPFYRYAQFETNDLVFSYQNNANVTGAISLSGKLTSNTGGLLIGVQRMLGKHIYLDTWLLGPHYGSGTGIFNGISSQPLTPDEQNDLKQQLEDLDIPLTHKTVTVNANGVSIKLDGPWGWCKNRISNRSKILKIFGPGRVYLWLLWISQWHGGYIVFKFHYLFSCQLKAQYQKETAFTL